MTKTIDEIDQEIENYIKTGLYPIVTKDIIEKIANFKENDEVKNEREYTTELYSEYLKKLNDLPKKQRIEVLNLFKGADLIDNQKLEKEDSFLMSLYLQIEKTHAIDELLREKKLNHKVIKKAHGKLMEGTSSKTFDNYEYRTNNRRFVGNWKNNQRQIEYLPLPFDQINETMEQFFHYYNQQESDPKKLFIKPFAIHGMIASLQVFSDGNTRLARLLQHTKLLELTNQQGNESYPLPTIYVTRTYYPFRGEYRKRIKNLAINTSNQDINEWMKFNLRRTQEQLWLNNENIEKVKKLNR